MVDLRLLRHFETVFRLGSFSKAAEALGLTHSAITKSIKALEDAWDVRLFNRTTRLVAPTEAGRRLFPMAVDLLAFADTVEREATQGMSELRIISSPVILETFIHRGILEFRTMSPATRISAETMPPELAIEELVQRRAHLLLYHDDTVMGLPYGNMLRVKKIVEEPYHVVARANHPVFATDLSMFSLFEYDTAIAGFDAAYEAAQPAELRAILREHGFPTYRLLSQAACFDMVRQSDVLTMAPGAAIKELLERGDVDAALHPSGFQFSMTAATLIDTPLEPTVAAFLKALETVWGDD